LNNGRLKAFTADKGEQLLDIELPVNSGAGPPMTYMLDGKQYIAVMAGQGAVGGRGGGGRGAGAAGRGAPAGGGAAPVEPTTAAAQRGNNAPAPAGAGANNPKLFVYAVPN
jgi:hypothetical protein